MRNDSVIAVALVLAIFGAFYAFSAETRRDVRATLAELRRGLRWVGHKLGLAPPPPPRRLPPSRPRPVAGGSPPARAPAPPPPRRRQPKPGAPGLDFEVPTRSAALRTALGDLERFADHGAARVISISGPPGSGKLTVARRYAARLRHHGYIVDPPLEVVCTGRMYVDGPAIAGQSARAPLVESPDELPGALRAAGKGAVIIHRAERMSFDAQCALDDLFQPGGWIIPIGSGRPTGVQSVIIATRRLPFPAGYREKVSDGLETFEIELPSLAERSEDIEPNFDHVLRGIDQRRGTTTTFEPGAREDYVRFATSRLGLWRNGFPDLIASAERLVAAAGGGGVISAAVVRRETSFLTALWAGEEPDPASVVPDEKAETPARPSLEHEVPTRNEVYRAELVRLGRRADLADPQLITIIGPPGSGRASLIQRYLHRRRLQAHVGAPVLEYTATGDDFIDCAALIGHHDHRAGAPPTQAGLLVDAADGAVIIHHADRLAEGGQELLLAVHRAGGRLPMAAYRDVVVRAHVIVLIPATLPQLYRVSLGAALEDAAFRVPGLSERLRDIEPSIDHLLRKLSAERGTVTTFAPEARADYLYFATARETAWNDNFDDLERSIGRLVAGAQGSVITADDVEAETGRLWNEWDPPEPHTGEPGAEDDDEEAGGEMLRRSLARFGLTFEGIKAATQHLPPLPAEPPGEAWDVLRREVPELSPEVMKRVVRLEATLLAMMVEKCRASPSEWDAAQALFHRPTEPVRNRVPQLRDALGRYGLTYARLKGN